MKAGITGVVALAISVWIVGCDQRKTEASVGPYDVVSVDAQLAEDGTIHLAIRNTAREFNACFWRNSLPVDRPSVGFRIVGPDGQPRAVVNPGYPTGSSVLELQAGGRLEYEIDVRQVVASPLVDGDLLMFESQYFSCADAGRFNWNSEIPAASLGVVRGSWRVSEGTLVRTVSASPN